MENLYVVYMGINTTHKAGEFHEDKFLKDWVVMCFQTPFVYYRENHVVEGNAGDCLINSPGTFFKHGPIENSSAGFKNDWIYIGGDNIYELINRYKLPVNTAFPTGNIDFLKKYLKDITFEKLDKAMGYEDKIPLILQDMLIDLGRVVVKDCPANQKNYAALEQIRHEMFNKIEYKWNINEMARCVGYSVSHFMTLYKNVYGCSPIADLNRMRVNKAKGMLSFNEYTISQISDFCGFSSVGYFINVFKKETGETPLKFRKMPAK